MTVQGAKQFPKMFHNVNSDHMNFWLGDCFLGALQQAEMACICVAHQSDCGSLAACSDHLQAAPGLQAKCHGIQGGTSTISQKTCF